MSGSEKSLYDDDIENLLRHKARNWSESDSCLHLRAQKKSVVKSLLLCPEQVFYLCDLEQTVVLKYPHCYHLQIVRSQFLFYNNMQCRQEIIIRK